jgi:gluconolactonase
MGLFPLPEVLKTEVFASVPERYRKKDIVTHWVETHRSGAPTDCFLEGPSFDRAGNLYVTDIPFGRIFRISPVGEFDLVAEYDGEPNGLKIHKDGRIFIADHKRGILIIDPVSGKVTPFLERRHTEGFKGVNDLVFGMNGDIYFTDQGQTGLQDPSGRVLRLTPAGKLETLMQNVPSPNGLVLNPAENILYVAVTRGNAIWRLPLLLDGTTSKVGVFIYLSGGIGPDGIAMDESGGLAVAHVGMGAVWIFNNKGIPKYKLESCRGDMVTNLAYGGPKRQTLFIVESRSGTILTANVPVAGRIMYSHM